MNMKDIAKLAGVSTVTVSNVINQNFSKVSQETIERVQKIIDENHYKPNAMARSLALKESKIIGVVIPYLGPDEAFSVSPYYTQILAKLENYVRSQGYYLMIRCVKDCKEGIPIFLTWNIDGIILLGAYEDEGEYIRKRLKVPTVYIDTYSQNLKIANVGIDDFKGGYLATRYLLGKGHREIAFAGPSIDSPGVIQQRYQGFCRACTERNIEVIPDQIFEAYTLFESGVDIGKKIAFSEKHYTAVVAMSDILAFGIMEGIRLSGLNVPEDISVIGFDNLPECLYSNPQLTTVSQNIEEKAFCAGEYLFQMIRDKKKVVIDKKIDIEIVERQSVKTLIHR